MWAMRILGSIAVVIATVMVGGVLGASLAGSTSSCSGYECVGAVYTGMFFGALIGFVVGLVIVTRERGDTSDPTT